MKGQSSYVPPRYIPLGQSGSEAEGVPSSVAIHVQHPPSDGPAQWSSGICACFDDMQSCMLLPAL
ncbi:unnamed protein product [Ilex paraguariensis]|uniref:Uncharacterized protein n=1 Tax=Ilex paraguariensis TaxID=185542 RepID=A0ABC8RZ77_9AQUA